MLSLLVAKVYLEFKSKIGIEEMEQHWSAGCSKCKEEGSDSSGGIVSKEEVHVVAIFMCVCFHCLECMNFVLCRDARTMDVAFS